MFDAVLRSQDENKSPDLWNSGFFELVDLLVAPLIGAKKFSIPTSAVPIGGRARDSDLVAPQPAIVLRVVAILGYGTRSAPATFRISIAALRPFTPMTLPPGCVHAPHRKTPDIGVRGDNRWSHM